MTKALQDVAHSPSPRALRQRIREGWDGLTTGLAPGYLQGNLVILPHEDADAFLRFCELNSQACPVLGASRPGECGIPELASDFDIRTDVGSYQVWRNGRHAERLPDIVQIWERDLVAVVLGCWFSAEAKLAAAGVRMRHLELGIQGGLFRTTRPCVPAGRFATNMVASMRPFARDDVARVTQITSNLPKAHGEPIHIGDPAELGIANLGMPDFGEELLPLDNEIPMFWACGLTASEAVTAAKCRIAITHVPGRMVITDLAA